MRAVYRKALEVDFAVDAEARDLLEHWTAIRADDGRTPVARLSPLLLARLRDDIEILAPAGDGTYRYMHHGENLARASGVRLGGRTTAWFKPDVAAFFTACHGLAASTGEVVYAVNESALTTPVHAWRRFHFPFHDDDGAIACIIGLVRPTLEKHRAWQAVSTTVGFGAASLEPMRTVEGRIDDFLLIEAAGLAPLLSGRSPITLGELLGRSLEPALVDALLAAANGDRLLTETIAIGSDTGPRDLQVDVHASEIGLILTMRDVTETITAQRLVEKRTGELRRAQAIGRIAGWSMDVRAKTLVWSPELIGLLRLDPQTFVATPKSVNALYVEQDRARAQDVQRRVFETGVSASVDVSATRGDGTLGHYILEFSADRDAEGVVSGIFGTVQDITERKEAELMLEKLAYFDPLTGLPNRAMFKKELERKIEFADPKRRPFHLMLLDLDHFKDVNDTLGHGAGDMLLIRVARLLRQAAPADALVARLGGDEFAILYHPQEDEPAVERLADAIVMEAAEPILLEEGEVTIGISMGIARGMTDGETVAQLLKNADLALYSAKGGGRGRFHFYDAGMSGKAEERISLGRDLKKALSDDGLMLHFQPIVSLGSRKVVGFEALLRWLHPTRGYVPPAEFIPIAESSSLICDLGFWVLNCACRTMKAWIDAGHPPLEIAVNVSAVQVWQTALEQEVADILQATGLPPHLLKLEVTESVFMDSNSRRVRDCFQAIADLGVRLSIDDFGTGYSSLSYLSALPFSELKIDRSFVAGIDTSSNRQKLLQGIIGLARGLNMATVIEGAETQAEVLMLQALGCQLVQGFHFARPQPYEAWPAMIARIEDGAGATPVTGHAVAAVG
jgi:diguanylate cyclase (GGDEF)-like protein